MSPSTATSTRPDDPRFAALAARDAASDGRFVYAVRTTGVYCRPSCAARPARRENVSFFDRAADAEAAGFRACKRCRPDVEARERPHAALVAGACRRIEAADAMPSLADMATAAGLSPAHFHRVFKAETGLTPRAYAAAERSRRVRDALSDGRSSVTEAIFGAGYNASSRFYETAAEELGMSPGAFRKGGRDAEIRFAVARSSLGEVLVAASPKGVCAILLGDDPDALVRDLQDRFPQASLVGGDREFEATVAAVIGLVEEPRRGLDLPLDIRGTAFQQRVWQALRNIPPGETATYAALAARIGDPRATRAVAGACAANPLAVAVPCHRVIRQDGSLSGYRWGVERKRDLLARESRPG